MINWNELDTVLLDMDGTLLDLNFDNYFWQQHVPLRYAEKNDLDIETAKKELFPKFRNAEGTIDWYCVDYWSEQLGLDILMLKTEVEHLIAIHPHVLDFLDRIHSLGKRSLLVTNAHNKSLMLKLERTSLHHHLDEIICAHDYGMPKEDVKFWDKLNMQHPFDTQKTLLVDDSLPVLRSAKRYGIKWLLGVKNPDSQNSVKDMEEFNAIVNFNEIMP